MKAQYPNSLTKDKYSSVLSGKYLQKYPEFSLEQIKLYVPGIVNAVSGLINEYDSVQIKLARIKIMTSLNRLSEINEEGQSQTVINLFVYLGKWGKKILEKTIRDDYEERDIPFPEEHKKKYLKFVSEMTAEAIDDICRATKAKLNSEKSHSERVTKSKETPPKTFVERVRGGSTAAAKEEEKTFAGKENKKKRVRFADDDMAASKK